MKSGAHAIAYETVTARDGSLPLLTPMSEVAGRMSVQVGATLLQKAAGGSGVLIGGVPGTAPARVLVIGGGVAGAAAAEIAVGMRAAVTIIDKSLARLRELDVRFGGQVRTLASTSDVIGHEVAASDLVIGSVLVPGAAAPKLVSEKMISAMRSGSVVVDIAIDQGGCFATSRPTTHAEPTYVVHGVTHYCVTNMPGAVGRTSTFALCNATLPWVLKLASGGVGAARDSKPLASAVNIHRGRVTNRAVAETGTFDPERHPDFARVIGQMRHIALAYRERIKAERAAGASPHSCLPDGEAEITTDVLIAHLRSYTPQQREAMSVDAAFAELMAKTYPCP